MTTQAVYDALPPRLQSETHQIMNAEFKGKQEKYPIFLVVWEDDDMERTRFNVSLERRPVESIHVLTLSYNGQLFKINAEPSKGLVLGRGDDCDIIVSNSFASRAHVRVESRFGKFCIVDQSTNGTYVRFSDGHIEHITREEKLLQGSGCFSLGQASFENASEFIEFSIDFGSRKL